MFSTESTTDATGTIDYARSGSHEEGDSLREVWRFTSPSGKVSIIAAHNGYQSHYFSSDPKTEARGREWNGAAMTAVVKPR